MACGPGLSVAMLGDWDMGLPKVKMFWDNCIKCNTKLKTKREKNQGYCKLCWLKQKLYELSK